MKSSQAAVNEAKKLGVDLSKVQASGTDGTVRKSDVQAHNESIRHCFYLDV